MISLNPKILEKEARVGIPPASFKEKGSRLSELEKAWLSSTDPSLYAA